MVALTLQYVVAPSKNPEWWDRQLDWIEERFVPLPGFVVVVLWAFLVVVSIRHSAVYTVFAVLSLPLAIVALLVQSRRATVSERQAFERSFSSNAAVAQDGEGEWRRLHQEQTDRLAPLRRLSWLLRPWRPSFRTAMVALAVDITVGVVLAIATKQG